MTDDTGVADPTWPGLLSDLIRGEDQAVDTTAWAMEQILEGVATPAQMAAFLVALRAKGETVDELTGLARTMIKYATPLEVPGPALDIVGSGGDRAGTVNISTMAAIVAAAAGTRVVKHGNRAASSACGSADLLQELGLVLDLTPEQQHQVIAKAGIGFLFAAHYHPAFRHAGPVRRELGVPTAFNFLGPLTNPAQPSAVAVGVADARMAGLLAGVFASRGQQGLVFHGDDGLDELTTTTSSKVWVFGPDTELTTLEFDPAALGLARSRPEDLVGGPPPVNAQIARDVLAGAAGPVRDIVLLNAAAGLTAWDGPQPDRLVAQLGDNLQRVATAIDTGAAAAQLEQWVTLSRAVAS
ncbi:anthranilate phosphoribosyltransferase [Microlunatus sp. GCM10028923]|uniref:anthranilate phosphoribosyltransferase n=1 Tax=Microlunatus sp. GCM10028923 TaxID=3273400 RepID=UPI00361D5FD5